MEAEEACMAYGGHLASLADEDENIFFGSVIDVQQCYNIGEISLQYCSPTVDDRQYSRSVANGTNVWLGGFSRKPNEWAWTDDSEWSYDEWKVRYRSRYQIGLII